MVQRADIIYPGHDQAFRVVNGKIEYVTPFEVTITGISADRPGLSFESSPPWVNWVMPGIEEQKARLEELRRQRG